MASGQIQWAPRFVLTLTEDEAVELSNILGDLALAGELSDNALLAWQRLSAMTIEANEMRRGN